MVQPPVEKNDLYVLFSKKIPDAIKLRDAFNAGFIQIQVNSITPIQLYQALIITLRMYLQDIC